MTHLNKKEFSNALHDLFDNRRRLINALQNLIMTKYMFFVMNYQEIVQSIFQVRKLMKDRKT